MSYARFGADGSNVYVFMHVDGYLCCCGCSLGLNSARAYSTAEMVEHLRQHTLNGDTVPDYVVPELLVDDAENFPESDATLEV